MHMQSVVYLALGPWILFFITEIAIALMPWRFLAWSIAFMCLCVAILCFVIYQRERKKFYLHFAVLGAYAVVVAGMCGAGIYDRHAMSFWMGRNRASHSNVKPSESALAYTDANTISFTKGARVDTLRSFGLRGLDSGGYIFCVAPVMDRTLAEHREVHFWAVGRDCCEPLSGFRCGDALRPDVRAGAVVASGGGVGSSFAAFKYRQYNRAAQQAAEMFQLTTESQPVFLWWTADPMSATVTDLSGALEWVLVLGLLYLFLSFLLAGVTFWQDVYGQQSKRNLSPV